MKTLLTLATLGSLAGAFMSFAQDPRQPATSARNATVLDVRHAEMQPMTKTERDPGLVKEGQLRAERLAHTLQAAGVTRVFATDFKRTQQTAAIVAKALSLKVTTYGHTKNFLKQLAALSDGEVVLVVAHANTLPAMVKGLGGKLDGLDKWGFLPESEHDRVILQHLHSEDAEMALRAVQTLDLRIEMP